MVKTPVSHWGDFTASLLLETQQTVRGERGKQAEISPPIVTTTDVLSENFPLLPVPVTTLLDFPLRSRLETVVTNREGQSPMQDTDNS